MKRHNGIEWDEGGRWVDGHDAETRIAKLEAEVNSLRVLNLKNATKNVTDVHKLVEEKQALILEASTVEAQFAKANGLLDEVEKIYMEAHSAEQVDTELRYFFAKRKEEK